jgi:hypothetical protein
MLKRIISGLLVLIVLTGTVGVNYDSHYCGGEFVKSQISILPSTLSCGMKMEIGKKCNDRESFSRVCCSNDHISFELNEDYNVDQVLAPAFISNFSIPVSVIEEYNFIDEIGYSFLGYSPPPIDRDIVVFYQSFLI